ncbi:YoaK family protein [Kytococcus sp. Marseille-QA3725]
MLPTLHRLRDHLRHIAGPERTATNNRNLAAGLAFTAGMLNSVGFLAVALYSSHMTGLTATLADQLVLGNHPLALLAALGIASFVVGAAMCALLFNWLRRRRVDSRFAVILVVEALAMLLVGLLADTVTGWGHGWVVVAVLCWTMGLQNAVITKVTGATIRTTHVTGMVTDLGIELGKLLYRNPPDDPDPVRADRQRMALHLTLVLAFVLGGLAGAVTGLAIGYRAVVPPAALLLVLASFPIADDLRAARDRSSR